MCKFCRTQWKNNSYTETETRCAAQKPLLIQERNNLRPPKNEETLLRKHFCFPKCFPKCFPVCADRKHLLRKHFLLPRNKNVSDFFQKHFVFSTNVSPFAGRRNNVSATVFPQQCFLVCGGLHAFSMDWLRAWNAWFKNAASLANVHVKTKTTFKLVNLLFGKLGAKGKD